MKQQTYWALQGKKDKQQFACTSFGDFSILVLPENYPPINYNKEIWKPVKVKLTVVEGK